VPKRRKCSKCGRNRAERFYVSARGRVCLTCRAGRVRLAARDIRLRESYGLSLDDYEALMAAQKHACAICLGRRPYNLDIDHDHALERAGVPPRESVRGLLCKQCNRRVLRSARDDAALLRRAADYLDNPPAREVLR
jgi:Recombination endonuclease VII